MQMELTMRIQGMMGWDPPMWMRTTYLISIMHPRQVKILINLEKMSMLRMLRI
jgi:hypothetical protein